MATRDTAAAELSVGPDLPDQPCIWVKIGGELHRRNRIGYSTPTNWHRRRMQRKLTAILDADVVGWSRLSETDEAGTLTRLKQLRARILDPLMAKHGGRVVKLLGDGTLAEFPSVVDAVACALAIQQAMADAEPHTDEDTRIRFRIGVNLGDVIIDGDDIYGEGVNVAARLQTLAPAGGVSISRTVRDHIENKLACTFGDMGEHAVKSHERPLHAFSVRLRMTNEERKVDAPIKLSICVLPFANMSGDVEQEYFSDGISEDIITDLSKVSALGVIARNTSFQFKGKSVDVPQVARQLKVSHVLEGSVRKAGGRVRITAQLINGQSGEHVWGERYDRDLSDIFALQDEISAAIVKALKLKLLADERKAIEKRGTNNVEAYNIFLMARQHYVTGNEGDVRREKMVARLCSRATEIDPSYGSAWALMALAKCLMPDGTEEKGDGGLADAERALALDGNLAEAHAVKARILFDSGRQDESAAEIETALRLDPESYEVNRAAGNLSYRQRKFDDAIRYFEKSSTLMETEFNATSMLISCYSAIGDSESAGRVARVAFARAERVVALDPNNGTAMDCGVTALAQLGEAQRAKEWISRALLIHPENMNMRYNFACVFCASFNEIETALDLLGPVIAAGSKRRVHFAKIDPDLEPLRSDPRFKAMIAAADARLAAEEAAAKSTPS